MGEETTDLQRPNGQKQRAVERYKVRRMRESLRGVHERCQRREPVSFVSAGNTQLDEILGGLRRKRVTVLGAETSFGKSSFAMMVIDEGDRAGKRILYVSAEDDETSCAKRIAARRTGIAGIKLRDERLDDAERDLLHRYANEASLLPWFLDAIGMGAEEASKRVAELCAEEDYDLVIVDYLQCFKAKAQDRRNEVTTVARLFADAVKSKNAAGLFLSQIVRPDRAVGKNWKPGMHDLKESGDIENMAEHILIGWTSAPRQTPTMGDERQHFIDVAKNKDGPRYHQPIRLPFNETTASFVRL